MKGYLLKLATAFLFAFGLTVFLYWPIYQKIPLGNQTVNIDQEVSRLDLSLNEDIKEILDRSIQLPPDRHELCLKNKNGFHFIHADSNSPGAPFLFYTDDLNQDDFGKVNKLGAMGINFYYQDNSSEVLLYREFGQPRECSTLGTSKLKNYASSTIEYSYMGLNRLEEFDLEGQGKLVILRSIVGGYFIDTSKSSVYIVARWEFFLLTLLVLFAGIKLSAQYWQKMFSTFAKFLNKDNQHAHTS